MTKKEYILAVIDALPEWEMWRWIKAMVQNDQLDEQREKQAEQDAKSLEELDSKLNNI